MKRKLLALVGAALLIFSAPALAAPVTQLATFKIIPTDQDVAGFLVGDTALYIFGNNSAGGYVTALNKDGSQKWQHNFSDLSSFVITAGSIDVAGNIWLLGASAPPIAIAGAPAASIPSAPALNPDGIVIGEEGSIRADLMNLTLWKVTSAGEGADKYQLPLTQPVLPTSMSINKSGISIVAWQATGSLFVTADLTGKFGKPLNIGKATTTLDKVIRNSDGSSILFGSSTELFLATKAIGIRDGLILKVDTTPKIVQSVRSGEKGASRNWANATSSLLLGGYLKSSSSSLATVTKFAATLKPTWSVRYKATSGAVVANGSNGATYAAYEYKGAGTLNTFDKNGKVISSATFIGQPVSMQFNRLFGLYLLSGATIYNLPTK